MVIIDPVAYARRTARLALAPLRCQVQELNGQEPGPWRRRVLAEADVLVAEPAAHGAEALRWLRQLRAHNPGAALIVCTAWTSREAILGYRRAGACDVIAKPFAPLRLCDAVRLAAESQARRRGAPGEPRREGGPGGGA